MTRTMIAAAALAALTATGASAQAVGTVDSEIGKVLVAMNSGLTLYTFRNDTAGTSNCYDSCADAWPPFTASADAADQGGLTVIDRNDGSKQWALNGQPLYFWAGDARPGDVNGDGVGGVWDAVKR